MRLSSPEFSIGLARGVGLAQLRKTLLERGCGSLPGRTCSGSIGDKTPIDQNETGYELRLLCCECRRHESTHRVADDDARAEPHGAHRDSHVTCVLDHAVRSLGFVGIATASQIKCKQRAPPREAFGNAYEIQV